MKSRLLALASALLVTGAVAAPAAQADASTTVVLSQVAFRGPAAATTRSSRSATSRRRRVRTSAAGRSVGSNSTGTRQRARDRPGRHHAARRPGRSCSRTSARAATALAGAGRRRLHDRHRGHRRRPAPHRRPTRSSIGRRRRHRRRRCRSARARACRSRRPTARATAFIRKSGRHAGHRRQRDRLHRAAGPRRPRSAARPARAADPCPAGADGVTADHDDPGADAPCEGRTVTVRGIVTGIDDLYGSNFENIFRSDSGLWVQQATRPAGATTSSGSSSPASAATPATRAA